MKILMMSKSGDGLGIAQKLQESGHDVKVYIKEKGFDQVSLGIVDRITSWRPLAGDWADFVVADMVGFGHHAATFDKFEVPHLGFNEIADMLELDRRKQMEILRKVKIPTPETFEFDSPKAALDLIGMYTPTHPGFVLKPSGNVDTGKTFMCPTAGVCEWALDQYSGDQNLIAQRVVKGIEVSTEGWFNGKDWLSPFNHTFEEKRLFEGGSGPNTGSMGNVVTLVKESAKDRLVQHLKRMTPFLRAAEYRGPIDLNTIVNKSGIFALELTPRFGYDAIEALHWMMTEELGQFLLALSMGAKEIMALDQDQVGIAVRVSLPPYPNGKAEREERGLPIEGLGRDLRPFYLTDVYRDGKVYRWAASDGVLMKVVARDKTVKGARKLAYSRIDGLKSLDLQYRGDIGERVDGDLKQLRKWKIL